MKLFLPIVASAMLVSVASHAALRDPLIAGAKHCTRYFDQQERLHGIPNNLLAAISNTESGRWNKTLGMVLPWPWTINAEGKGYYFDSKAEAIRKVKELQRKGMRSIDIGCMQVNLRHHPDAFASVEQAFDPRYNVAYAATFLRGHYDDMKNWDKAIAAYHSKTPKYGNKYLARVQKSWDAITGKVRNARDALGTLVARERSPSYRIIKVRNEGETQVASLNKPIVRRFERPIGNQELSISVRDDDTVSSASAPYKGIALRPQDRLASGFRARRNSAAAKRISVSEAEQSVTRDVMVIRPDTRRLADPEVTLYEPAATSAGSSSRDRFVSQHGSGGSKSGSKTVKPKFIFVD